MVVTLRDKSLAYEQHRARLAVVCATSVYEARRSATESISTRSPRVVDDQKVVSHDACVRTVRGQCEPKDAGYFIYIIIINFVYYYYYYTLFILYRQNTAGAYCPLKRSQ